MPRRLGTPHRLRTPQQLCKPQRFNVCVDHNDDAHCAFVHILRPSTTSRQRRKIRRSVAFVDIPLTIPNPDVTWSLALPVADASRHKTLPTPSSGRRRRRINDGLWQLHAN
eukprot:7462021-Pyramimonas_sp.AAC.1